MFANRLPLTEQNLILTGYIGPDMPLLGRNIASRLGLPYANVEGQIAERLDMTIDEIRSYFGETRLKALEAEIVTEAALRRRTVVRISGRTLMHADHLVRLQSTGPVICLTISLDAMLQRLHINMGARYHDPAERALALGELQREWAVRGQSGIHEIDTTYLDTEGIVERVARLWQSLAIERA